MINLANILRKYSFKTTEGDECYSKSELIISGQKGYIWPNTLCSTVFKEILKSAYKHVNDQAISFVW